MNGLNVGLGFKAVRATQEIYLFRLDYPLGKYQSRPQGFDFFNEKYGV